MSAIIETIPTFEKRSLPSNMAFNPIHACLPLAARSLFRQPSFVDAAGDEDYIAHWLFEVLGLLPG